MTNTTTTTKTMTTPNNSYHNTLILIDCECFEMLNEKKDVNPEFYNRLTTDNCGNITHIDGKKVLGGNPTYWLHDETRVDNIEDVLEFGC